MGKETTREEFFGDGFFNWQLCTEDQKQCWDERHYDEERYWGGFSREPLDKDNLTFPEWAIGPFRKYEGNPVLEPSPDGWDCGHFGGGVHNGSILKKDGGLVYVYRGEFPCEPVNTGPGQWIDYRCDIGIAHSRDGRHFVKDMSRGALFGAKESGRYSYEDVNLVTCDGKYYLFCNRWEWEGIHDPSRSGAFLAVSDDLAEWTQVGLLFPDAGRIHRNPCVLQNPDNEAVRVDGRYVMYLNDGLVAFSEDLVRWTSEPVDNPWPGGEGCLALADHHPGHPDDIILFTGGHHTGHFYAVGEVLIDRNRPKNPVEWLPRPIMSVDPDLPYENGFSRSPPHTPISHWRDTVFFTGLTRFQDEWLVCYGGSEYYTCIATAPIC